MNPLRSKALCNLPKDRALECQLKLSGCMGHVPGSVVLCHLRGPWSLGKATKPHDIWGIYACSRCHDVLDGRATHDVISDTAKLTALLRSQDIMIKAGLLTLFEDPEEEIREIAEPIIAQQIGAEILAHINVEIFDTHSGPEARILFHLTKDAVPENVEGYGLAHNIRRNLPPKFEDYFIRCEPVFPRTQDKVKGELN